MSKPRMGKRLAAALKAAEAKGYLMTPDGKILTVNFVRLPDGRWGMEEGHLFDGQQSTVAVYDLDIARAQMKRKAATP